MPAGALALDQLTWPEVEAEIAAGRDTVVVCFGATEQHGRHMPLATDALLGDEFGRRIAERLGAFVAPTVRVGCSSHHLGYAGTLSVSEETFHGVVEGIVDALERGGFRRAVLMPTHGGNFAPLGAAVERIGERQIEISAVTDLSLLIQATLGLGGELGVPSEEGGVHAGEWETSLLLAIRPDLVKMDAAEAGYTGELESGIQTFFEQGARGVAENGVFGDPARASAEHGERYAERLVDLVLEAIEGS